MSLLQAFAKKALSIAEETLDADRLLQRTMAGFIETAKSRYAIDAGAQWKPGEPLKLLLAGYSGTRNTGADVRVEEMIRQFRHLFDDEHVDLSILTIDPELSKGYFKTVKQLHLPQVFPKFLFDTIHQQHGVIACEGSMFKSKFANALATMMVGSLGLALAEGKMAIGYGGEAGKMDASLEALVRKYCEGAFILARNTQSCDVLADLGIEAQPGTDTAWTFEPAPDAVGQSLLRAAGWDGESIPVAICPINPFWWPVQPDLFKGMTHALTGAHKEAHYSSVYFHADSDEIREKQDRYLTGLANAVIRFGREHRIFPVMIGMEQLDRKACQALAEKLQPHGYAAPLVVSDEHDMYQMVSVLRQMGMLVSSRYHAIVTSMGGLVPSAGVTMDERIRNLMEDRGQQHLFTEVDAPDLEERVFTMLSHLHNDRDAIKDGIGRTVVRNLERMGRMGMALVEHVRSHHPDFPFAANLGAHGNPFEHLPKLPEAVADLVREYGAEDVETSKSAKGAKSKKNGAKSKRAGSSRGAEA